MTEASKLSQAHQLQDDWIAELPKGWEAKRLKFLISEPFRYGANESTELTDPTYPRYIRITDVGENGLLRDDTFCSLLPEIAKDYLLAEGDILLARSGATVGKSLVYRSEWGPAAYAGYLIRARTSKKLSAYFLFYFLQSHIYRQWLNSIFIQATIQNVSAEKYANLEVPVPPMPMQLAITEFLDRRVKQFDELILKKKALIEKLREKRIALISSTVVRGIPTKSDGNKNSGLEVELKDSGVDWIGSIPSHWSICKFSREVKIAQGQVDPLVEPFLTMPLIGPEHVEAGMGRLLSLASAEEQSAESGKYLCKQGAVIYSKIRPALKKVVMAPCDCLCSADMYPLTCRKKLNNKYLFWFLLSDQFSAWSVLEADRVAMPKINRETLNQLKIPVPPIEEQTAIVLFLEKETEFLDRLIDRVEVAIQKLIEYRVSLITAAVSGQLKIGGNLHE